MANQLNLKGSTFFYTDITDILALFKLASNLSLEFDNSQYSQQDVDN